MTSTTVIALAWLLSAIAAMGPAGGPAAPAARAATGQAAAVAAAAGGATAPTEAQDADRKRIRTLIDSRELAEAESAARSALAELDRQYGPDSLPAARILDLLAETVRRRQQVGWVDEATALATRAVDIKTKALGPSSPELGVSLKELGAIQQRNGDLDAAAPFYERAIRILEPTAAADDPDLATLCTNFGLLRRDQGRLAEAAPLLERALRMRERHFGYVSPEVARVLDNLVNLELDRFDFEQALVYAERNLTICEQLFPADHPNLAAPLENKARALYMMGDYRSARSLYRRAIAIREQSEDAQTELANDLNSLATVLDRLGAYDEARTQYERSLEMFEGLEAEGDVAAVLNNMTDFLVRRGQIDEAAGLFERSLSLMERLAGPDDARVAKILQGYGRVEMYRGHAEPAGRHFKRALEIDRVTFGNDHPETAGALLNHAWFLATRGDLSGAVSEALGAETIGRDSAVAAFGAISERAALRFAEERVSGIDLAQSIVGRGTDAATRLKVWSSVIRARGLVLDEMSARARLESAPGGPRSEPSRRRLQAARAEYARLLVGGADTASSETPEQHRRRLEAARQERERAEQDFALRSASFARARAAAKIGLAEVRAALPAGSALVAFSKYNFDDLTGRAPGAAGAGAAYLAYVLPGAGASPAAVDLGPAAKIESLIEDWLTEAATGPARAGRPPAQAEAAYRAAGARLGEAVWSPIAGLVAGTRRVFIVPDGALHLVNFAALPVGDIGYLVESGPLLHQLTTERQLVVWSRAAPVVASKTKGLMALGGIDFDASIAAGGMEAAPPSTAPASTAPAAQAGGAGPSSMPVAPAGPASGRLPCSGFEQVRFPPLPGTVAESEAIGGIWEKAGRGWADLLSGGTASEAAFKAKAGANHVLHLATHGFFLRGGCVTPEDSSRGVGTVTTSAAKSAAPDIQAGENPLLLSGLALAGANNRLRARVGGEDGILLSEEIVGLDLANVDWAVLSACDTGVGEIAASEGVLGLRRAFQQAGVHTVITSLWSVKDQPTRQWMEALYAARFAAGKDTAEAVRDADLALLRERRAQGASTHPFYWAGFVATGDWR